MGDSRVTPILMPKWGLSMQEGILVEWLVEEGAEITVGDEIMEVETDKITSAVEAADAGTLRRCIGDVGETYPVRALLGVMAPQNVSDSEIEAYISAYEVPADEDDEEGTAESQYLFADTAVGRLRYAQCGADGPVLILVHGFGGDLDNWLFNIDALAAGARVYALDLPGHGQSEKVIGDPSLGGLAGALQAFMHTIGVDRAHLAGHSMGAAVVARLACDAPGQVESLTLISAAGLGPEINADYINGFVDATTRRELKPALMNLFADSNLVNRSLVDDVLKYKRIDGVDDALRQLASGLFADGIQQNLLAPEITDLSLDTLVIWGREDKVIPASQAHVIGGARVEIIDDAGHMVQMEQATGVNKLILDHISA